MLDFCDLLETVTRRRVTGTTQTPRGKVLPAATSMQVVRCLIQPHHGNLQYEIEGVLQSVTEAMYCNRAPVLGSKDATDIQALDTIVRASGQQLRVAFVADEGGQQDHYKVYLVAMNSGASATVD